MPKQRDESGRFLKEPKEEIRSKCWNIFRIVITITLSIIFIYPWVRFFKTPLSGYIQKAVDEYDIHNCPRVFSKDHCFKFLELKLKKEFLPFEFAEIDQDFTEFLISFKRKKSEEKKRTEGIVRNKAEEILIEIRAKELAKKISSIQESKANSSENTIIDENEES